MTPRPPLLSQSQSQSQSQSKSQSQAHSKYTSQPISQGSQGSDYVEVHEPSGEEFFYVRELEETVNEVKQVIFPIRALTQTPTHASSSPVLSLQSRDETEEQVS